MKAAPRYSQIISYYRSLIESGKLAEGDKMPTEETIGEIFGVSPYYGKTSVRWLGAEWLHLQNTREGKFCSGKKSRNAIEPLDWFQR